MANIIGTIADIDKIMEDCNIQCADDNNLCGDALCEETRCEDCNARILGKCLHQELHANVWEVKDMCTDCGRCTW